MKIDKICRDGQVKIANVWQFTKWLTLIHEIALDGGWKKNGVLKNYSVSFEGRTEKNGETIPPCIFLILKLHSFILFVGKLK
jgi:hypothetical protein